MEKITKKIKKSLKVAGSETKIERKGTITFVRLANDEETKNFLGDSLTAYAAIGYRHFIRQQAAIALAGGKKSTELKAALRQFSDGVNSLVQFVGMTEEEAKSKILANPSMKLVSDYFASQADAEEIALDFVSSVPVPEPYKSDDDEDEETTE